MRKRTIGCILLIVLLPTCFFLSGFGFNTIEWLVWSLHQRAGNQPQTWWMNNGGSIVHVQLDIWDAYFFCGILPFALGLFGMGLVVGLTAGYILSRGEP